VWRPRLDFSVRSLAAEWRPLLRGRRTDLWSDLRAGLSLSLLSLPVALALALAADLAPWRGLVAAADAQPDTARAERSVPPA